ncbi:MAG: hypothetical protein ACLR2E_23565 [Lachnospiraceae bacterium]
MRTVMSRRLSFYHMGSGTTGSRYSEFKVRYSARNNLYVVYKNMPALQLILNLPFLLAGCIVKYFFFGKGYGRRVPSGLKRGLSSDEKREKSRFPTRKFFSLSADSVGTLGEYYKKSERV